MEEYIYINGTEIKICDIKEFALVQREYIYRPSYVEAEKSIKNSLFGKKYHFVEMQPYAAIFDENKKDMAISQYNAKDFKESIGKDFFEGVLTKVGEKFDLKTIRSKKYKCVNQAGRVFSVYLEDVPAQLTKADGNVCDVRKNDPLYYSLGEPIAPSVRFVKTLIVKTKQQKYVFYGEGIQIEKIEEEYEKLKEAVIKYRENKKVSEKIKKVPIPKFLKSKKNNDTDIEDK